MSIHCYTGHSTLNSVAVTSEWYDTFFFFRCFKFL